MPREALPPRPSPRPLLAERTASLTGLRAVAALLIVGTHAAYGTGQLANGYLGALYARLEIGVPIFFALSGFLLFRPWVRAAAAGTPSPSLRRYAFRRIQRIAPAYLVVVLIAYALYQFRDAGPNPGHTWTGLLHHLTLTQIYEPVYFFVMHQGLTQTWSLAVEFAFYAVLPLMAALLLSVLCKGAWRPGLLLLGLASLAAITPLWLWVQYATDLLPGSAGMWLPAHLVYFVGGMVMAVLQVIGVRVKLLPVGSLAVLSYLVVSTSVAGDINFGQVTLEQTLIKVALYAVIAWAAVAALVLNSGNGLQRLLSAAPVVWLGEISYETFLLHVITMEIVMASVLHWPAFTGSWSIVLAVTLALTVPQAWLLRRWTTFGPPTSGRTHRRRSLGEAVDA
ncbi:acyltransferase [Mycobacterium barrassiae]|uniref:acyltransferase family protein n=1 Tax=Mycobacterium barrassiae TaxID=319709 RepID=UPI002265C2DB|nr:acyltransferase [Mycobacterium barrassiae]MCV7301599.1 acyltransferase [Mycobacterium barrassiae]